MTTRKFGLGVCCASVAALMAIGSACLAADFSADMVMSGAGGALKGKIYVSGNSVRQDMTMGNFKQITVLRMDKGVAYMISPFKKEYTEIRDPRITSQNPRSDAMLTRVGTKKSLGKEKVNGYLCEKTQYTSTKNPSNKAIRWFSKDLNWVVKTQMTMGASTQSQELKNVKIGKQPASLFEVPKGYKKVAMPNAKGMPGGPRPAPRKK